MTVGPTLRQSRLTAGLSQAELAERSGTSQATLCAYERGHKSPTAATLERILAAAGYKLALEPKRCRVVTPSRTRLEQNARTLNRVLELAAELPTKHEAQITHPPLRELLAQTS